MNNRYIREPFVSALSCLKIILRRSLFLIPSNILSISFESRKSKSFFNEVYPSGRISNTFIE